MVLGNPCEKDILPPKGSQLTGWELLDSGYTRQTLIFIKLKNNTILNKRNLKAFPLKWRIPGWQASPYPLNIGKVEANFYFKTTKRDEGIKIGKQEVKVYLQMNWFYNKKTLKTLWGKF